MSSSSIEWACTPFAKTAHSGRSGAFATTAVSAVPSSAPIAASMRATASAVSTVAAARGAAEVVEQQLLGVRDACGASMSA